MNMNDLNSEQLEQLIDRYGLAWIVDVLSTICEGKAEHIMSNWQDEVTATVWDKASVKLRILAHEFNTPTLGGSK